MDSEAKPNGSEAHIEPSQTPEEAEDGEMDPGMLESLRMPKTDKMIKAEAKIAKDPYDVESWNTLVMEALLRDVLTARDVFEGFFEKFPTAGRYWMLYAELEAKSNYHDRVKAIFGRCLRRCPTVELWRFYLTYIQKMAEDKPDSADDIKKAFEFALEHVGLDIASFPIWNDYINYLKNNPWKTTYEQQENTMQMRRVYQRAIVQPIQSVELIYNQYTTFENGLNKALATKFIRELSSKYMGARLAQKERKNFMDLINRNSLARPPLGVDKEEQQLMTWKSLIAWEKSNPLQLDSCTARVMFTYKQAFMALRFYPEIWVEAANYLQEIGQPDEAVNTYKQGAEALPASLLLQFSYAEFEESRKRVPEARNIFEGLLAFAAKEREEIQKALEKEQKAEKDRQKAKDNKDGKDSKEQEKDPREEGAEKEEGSEKILQLEEELKRKNEFESLVYITYMRFSKRSEDEQSLRAIFRRARESPACTYHVFVASAFMQPTKQVVCNIFEFGLKKFGSDPDYVLHYINYLWHMKDDSSQNLRSLFERTLATMPAEKARIIWQKYLEYELNNGDLNSIKKVDERLQKAYPAEAFGILGLMERYKYLDLLPCSQRESDIYAKLTKKTSASELQSNLEHVKSLNSVNQNLIDKAKFPRPKMDLLVKYVPDGAAPKQPAAVQPVPQPGQLSLPQPQPFMDSIPPSMGLPPTVPHLPLMQGIPPLSQLSPIEAVAIFMNLLPPPIAFQTSTFNVDELMGLIARSNFQPPGPPPPGKMPTGYYPDQGRDPKRKFDDEMGGPYGRDPFPGRRNFS